MRERIRVNFYGFNNFDEISKCTDLEIPSDDLMHLGREVGVPKALIRLKVIDESITRIRHRWYFVLLLHYIKRNKMSNYPTFGYIIWIHCFIENNKMIYQSFFIYKLYFYSKEKISLSPLWLWWNTVDKRFMHGIFLFFSIFKIMSWSWTNSSTDNETYLIMNSCNFEIFLPNGQDTLGLSCSFPALKGNYSPIPPNFL